MYLFHQRKSHKWVFDTKLKPVVKTMDNSQPWSIFVQQKSKPFVIPVFTEAPSTLKLYNFEEKSTKPILLKESLIASFSICMCWTFG